MDTESVFPICIYATQNTNGFDPLWLILLVNFLALFVVPLFTYLYSHINNLKVLKEKWLSEIRDVSIVLFEMSERIFKLKDLYCTVSHSQEKSSQFLKDTKRELEEAQSNFDAQWSKMRLLFKESDADFNDIYNVIKLIKNASDLPESDEVGIPYMCRSIKNSADETYLQTINNFLYSKWQEVQELRFWNYIWNRKMFNKRFNLY